MGGRCVSAAFTSSTGVAVTLRYFWVMTSPTLSLVIHAYNEADSIGWLLQSPMTESDQLDEIIVVDNSTDETPQIVAR